MNPPFYKNMHVPIKHSAMPKAVRFPTFSLKITMPDIVLKIIVPPVIMGYKTVAGRFTAPISWNIYETPDNTAPGIMYKRNFGENPVLFSPFTKGSIAVHITAFIKFVSITKSVAETALGLIWCSFEITLTKPFNKNTAIHRYSFFVFAPLPSVLVINTAAASIISPIVRKTETGSFKNISPHTYGTVIPPVIKNTVYRAMVSLSIILKPIIV